MSIASSQPIETRRRPPFYGPDQRYVPPADNGVALPDPLPGHMELPDENDEIVENFREAPQGLLLDQAIWPILERLHPDRHFAIGHDCGIYWKLDQAPWSEGRFAPTGFMFRAFPPSSMGTTGGLMSCGKSTSNRPFSSNTRRETGPKSATELLTTESSGSTSRRCRVPIMRSSWSRQASSKFTGFKRAGIGRMAPNSAATTGSSHLESTSASGTGSFTTRPPPGCDGTTPAASYCRSAKNEPS